MSKFRVYPDAASLARAAAEHFVTLATAAIATRGRFVVALSGGSTPKATYALLATEEFAARVDWPHVHVFWGDERCVPPDHPDSNYHMARETLLDKVPIPADNIHRIRGELEPNQAAAAYQAELEAALGTLEILKKISQCLFPDIAERLKGRFCKILVHFLHIASHLQLWHRPCHTVDLGIPRRDELIASSFQV
jgi:hypothetical protein